MKKLFGGINLTWTKLIIFAVVTAVYTALMAIIPATKDTSFRDIAIFLEWWIFFGIIIIANSKSHTDSALKCFVFFLISQPLIYLFQVPFSHMGWGLFKYYRYWFMWTLATIPMGFIGYYIKRKDIISMIVLLPMLIVLAFIGIGYLESAIETFPNHLLSAISCFLMIIVIILGLYDKTKYKIASIVIVLLAVISLVIIENGLNNPEFDAYRNLDEFNISYEGKIRVVTYSATAKGDVQVVNSSEDFHSVKLNGRQKGKYSFTIADEADNEYEFEYYFDKKENTVILKRV